ncbi:hypothetical protein VTJ04DRAFT_3148 [Mycothermus thermophilus]|uniref:uncharacterized protein n=1 Tax=Humicola insolens TaxID=85995 RepID=UPI00374405C2
MESDTFDTQKSDHLHNSLSNAWASFLAAQHCSREIASIQKKVDHHIDNVNRSIASLEASFSSQRTQHAVLSTIVTELKSKVDRYDSRLDEVTILQTRLSTLQQDLTKHSEDTSRKVNALSDNIEAQQTSLANLRSSTARDITSMQEQVRLVLSRVGSIQAELGEARAEKTALMERLVGLENQIKKLAQAQSQGLMGDIFRFLKDILPHRDALMKLLSETGNKSQRKDVAPMHEELSCGFQIDSAIQASQAAEHHIPYALRRSRGDLQQSNTQPSATTKREAPEHPQSPPSKRACSKPDPREVVRSLFIEFRKRYKTDPPKSDTVFIWQFLNSVEDAAMSKYIQESLIKILPEHVAPHRDKRSPNPQKYIMVSRELSWTVFRNALAKIPPMPYEGE